MRDLECAQHSWKLEPKEIFFFSIFIAVVSGQLALSSTIPPDTCYLPLAQIPQNFAHQGLGGMGRNT